MLVVFAALAGMAEVEAVLRYEHDEAEVAVVAEHVEAISSCPLKAVDL